MVYKMEDLGSTISWLRLFAIEIFLFILKCFPCSAEVRGQDFELPCTRENFNVMSPLPITNSSPFHPNKS